MSINITLVVIAFLTSVVELALLLFLISYFLIESVISLEPYSWVRNRKRLKQKRRKKMKKVKRKRKRKLKRLASPKAKMIMKRFHSILYF